MHTTSQLVPPAGRSALRGTRLRSVCPAYVLPHVRELPLRLEPAAPDTFGGLVTCRPADRSGPSTTHSRGALS